MRFALVLISTYLISSCARPDYAERWPDHFTASAGPQPGYAIKRVIDKQEPAVLVADDGSVCRTSAERFTRTSVGRWIACVWTLPSLDSTEIARAAAYPLNPQVRLTTRSGSNRVSHHRLASSLVHGDVAWH
jgi:hypothetical protein